jgi:hypothetical protein
MSATQATIGGITFERLFKESEFPSYLSSKETARALDNSLVSYNAGNSKRCYILEGTKITQSQKTSIESLYTAGNSTSFSLGDGTLSFTAQIVSPPNFVEEWAGMFSCKIELEEV